MSGILVGAASGYAPAGGGGGSPGYTDTFDGTTFDQETNVDDSGTVHQQIITLPAGTVTKLRFYVSTFGLDNLTKIALYAGSGGGGALIANGAGAATGTGWFQVTFSGVVITAGTYTISWDCLDGPTDMKFGGKSGLTPHATYKYTGSFAAFPQATSPAPDGDKTPVGIMACGAFITP